MAVSVTHTTPADVTFSVDGTAAWNASHTVSGLGALAQLNTVGTSQIDDDAVTYAKIQNVSATDKLLGRATAGAGDVEEIACTAAARTVLDDATVAAMVDTLGGASSVGSGGLARATSPVFVTPLLGTPTSGVLTNCTGLPTAGLVNDAVTYAKMQNVSAASKLLGRGDSGSGDPEEITLGTGLTMTGTTLSSSGGSATRVPPGGRLTLTTGVPVTTSDVTGAGTLYYTPYINNVISVYTGAAWSTTTFSEISLALTLTSGKNYDVFVDDDAVTLVLSAAWTNDTTRADALALQDGVTVLSSDHTKLWLGTIRASGSNTTEDSGGGSTTQVGGKRFVWNAYNAVRRTIGVIDTTDSWSYTTHTIRQAGGASGNKVEFVNGAASAVLDIELTASVSISSNDTNAGSVGVGIDSTSAFSGIRGTFFGGQATSMRMVLNASYKGMPGLGYHFASWNEFGANAGTCTFIGDLDSSQSGMMGVLFA